MSGAAMAREGALARNAAAWLVRFERHRRREGVHLLVEQQGRLTFDVGGSGFTLTARADRIELHGGVAHILDFKTGSPPSRPQVESDFAPQLTLTAAILERGGFQEIGAARPGELLYVQITGRNSQKDPKPIALPDESQAWSERAFNGLVRRVARFQSEATPYPSWAAPQYMRDWGGDYDHLARVWEWHVIGDEEGE
jgi:ATP-dependent helicase/nuclease subunit B